jgi:hypothetical protein
VFVAKNFDATSFSELVCSWSQFNQFCIDFCAVMKRSETPPKYEFRVQWRRSGASVAKNSDATLFSEFVR